MPEAGLSCPNCRTAWPADPAQLSALRKCGPCGREVEVEVFPAFTRPILAGSVGETIVDPGEAGCFYHPQRRASVPCGVCGRFLCALCDLQLNGQHLCPSCLETSRKKGDLKTLATTRTLYDSAALSLALLGPLFCLWGALILAPPSIVVALYGWNKPGSLIHRTRIRFVLALVLSTLELVGLGIIIYSMVTEANRS